MPSRFVFRFLSCVSFFAVAAHAWSREYHDLFTSAKTFSMGKATTAIVDDYDSLNVNPAGLALGQRRDLILPEFVNFRVSPDILDFLDAVKAAKDNSKDPIAKQLASFDGQSIGVGVDLLTIAWVHPRMAIAINPASVNVSARVNTPSLLYAKIGARVTVDSGVSLGYAYPFLKNKLRVGLTLRPFLARLGMEKELENEEIFEIDDPKELAGLGWGIDADLGVQGNLNNVKMLGMVIRPMAGAVVQNMFENKFKSRINEENFKGDIPPLERKVNAGIAGRIENFGILKPTLSVEWRDMLIDTDDWIEHLAAAIELKFLLKSWWSTALRAHFYKGNVGGGVGGSLGPVTGELGTYAVNLGKGPGIGVDRRYYIQLALVW